MADLTTEPKKARLTKQEAAEIVEANSLRGSIAAHQLDEQSLMNTYTVLKAKKEAKETATKEPAAMAVKEEELAEPTQEEIMQRQLDLEQKILGLLDEMAPKAPKTLEGEPQPT